MESVESIRKALSDLKRYIAEDGPFDGVIAFSVGATLAATLIISELHKHRGPDTRAPFKCAVFLSGGLPYDPAAVMRNEIQHLGTGGEEPIQIPTAHIWGSNDVLAKGTSVILSDLCNPHLKTVFVHDLGHDVPGARSHEAMNGAIRAIRRTIDHCGSSKRSVRVH